jgi:NADH:ubiquinone oxidoreductase subunit C
MFELRKKLMIYFFFLLKKGLNDLILINNDIILYVKKEELLFILQVLKNHTLFQYKILSDISVIDYPDNCWRFELNVALKYKNTIPRDDKINVCNADKPFRG